MPIKTTELCRKCKYGWENNCVPLSAGKCDTCDMWNSERRSCICPTIRPGTNCDRFIPKDPDTTWGTSNNGCEYCLGRAYTDELFEVIT